MASIEPYEVAALERQVKASGMINRVLVQICANEGLSKSGIKADLQQRIIESELLPDSLSLVPPSRHHQTIYSTGHFPTTFFWTLLIFHLSAGLHKHSRSHDFTAFNRLKNMISNPSSLDQPSSSPFRAINGTSSSSAANSPATPGSYLGTPNHSAAAYNMGSHASYRILGNPSKALCRADARAFSDGGTEIEFKSSPYYVVEEQLGNPTQCDGSCDALC